MLRKVFSVCAVLLMLSGCASVPMAAKSNSNQAKQFDPPPKGMAGLYVYRDSSFGAALKKDVWVDGKCLGQTAAKVFFHDVVAGNKEHTISTESEFSPNDIKLFMKSGENYFIRQYIKLGVFVGGANLEVVDPADAKVAINNLGLAVPGTCSTKEGSQK